VAISPEPRPPRTSDLVTAPINPCNLNSDSKSNMQSRLLYLFTRTPLHVGAGSSVGAIDQPVQRERHTGFPIIPGSSLKGVLRDHMANGIVPRLTDADINKYFGQGGDGQDFTAGMISFGEAKLLAFPVRSAKGAFALVTCSLALQRYAREAGLSLVVPPSPRDGECLAGSRLTLADSTGRKGAVLEEYRFAVQADFPVDWEKHLSSVLNDEVLKGSAGRYALLSDGDFAHFAINACQVQQHVRINHDTGTADDGGLFNEETVPSESLFIAPLTPLRGADCDNVVLKALSSEQLIQFGGNGTIGLGYCTAKLG
jgi:CRISPR-associated protein Cmr4